MTKKSPANAGAAGHMLSIPWSGRTPGGGNGNPLQYSCRGTPMDRGASGTTVHEVTNVRHDRVAEHDNPASKRYHVISLTNGM